MSIAYNRVQAFPNAISEEINQVQKLLELLKQLEEFEDAEMYYTSKDVARVLNISVKEAQNYMNREDFPSLDVGKGARVNKLAFLMYNLERREKER